MFKTKRNLLFRKLSDYYRFFFINKNITYYLSRKVIRHKILKENPYTY